MYDMSKIRNFSIIAHIDHGKSTLADRLLEVTGVKKMAGDQVLDSMDLEREKGITIKSTAVTMDYKAKDGEMYELNLIDTPGHVDFTYEVSRCLAACEGAILVVDASQGMEAQTMSNLYLAMENNLEILPVINKIDLPSADIDMVKEQLIDTLGVDEDEIVLVSAKSGIGINELLEKIVEVIPAPKGKNEDRVQSLIFDSVYNPFRGVIPSIRVVNGSLKKGDNIKFMSTGKVLEVDEVGKFRLGLSKEKELNAGEVGYVIANIKTVRDTKVGDTITKEENPSTIPLPGYKEVLPMVYSGIFPIDGKDYSLLREALEKLQLNDAALVYQPENSLALGFGYRCGYLGMLHMEIVQERLRREYNLDIIATVPNVEFKVKLKDKDESEIEIDNPAEYPDPVYIDYTEEPFVKAEIIVLTEFVGNVMQLAQDRRGIYKTMHYIDDRRAVLQYELPLTEIIFDFYDKLKSISKGYASLDYEFLEFRKSKMLKLDILVNNEKVDALSLIVHESKAYEWGRKIVDKLQDLIPKHLFKIAVQAAIGNKVIARSTITAMRKNVTAKCYGGDITRKRKLLEKQKEGKKRMKAVGNVEIPQEAFLSVLKIDD